MRLNVKAMAIAMGLIWSVAVFLVALINWLQITIWNPPRIELAYGAAFLNVIDSIYPGYTSGGGWPSVIIGALYAVVDGAIGGAVLAWVYNKVVDRTTTAS